MTTNVSLQSLPGWKHLACFFEMVKNCTQRKVVFAKSVRFRMGWAEKLLLKLPDFKVIFLIRSGLLTGVTLRPIFTVTSAMVLEGMFQTES